MKKIPIKRNTRSYLLHRVQLAPMQFEDASALSGVVIAQRTVQGDEHLVAQTPMFIGGYFATFGYYYQKQSSVLSHVASHSFVQKSTQLHPLVLPGGETSPMESVDSAEPDFYCLYQVSEPEPEPVEALAAPQDRRERLPLLLYDCSLELAELQGRVLRLEASAAAAQRICVHLGEWLAKQPARCAGP